MAQRLKSEHRKKMKAVAEALPFVAANYWILGAGVALIVLGYIALAQDPWDGFMALVVAPILLVLGYCVVIPVGILFRSKQERGATEITTSGELAAH